MEIALFLLLASLAYIVLCFMAIYKMYAKTGVPGWYGFIPVYCVYVMNAVTFGNKYAPVWVASIILSLVGSFLAVIDLPFTLILSLVISIALIIYNFCLSFNFAKTFGWSTGGAVCYILFPWISIFILAFGSSRYEGPVKDTLVQNIGDKFLEN